MKKNKNLIVILLVAAFSIVYAIVFKWIQTGNPLGLETVFFAIMIFLNILIPLGIARLILKRYTHIPLSRLRKKIIPSVLIVAAGLLTIQLLLISGGVFLYFIFQDLDTTNFFSHLFSVEVPAAIKQFAIWVLIGSAAFFYYIWQRTVASENALRESNLKYRYMSLKSQVNPHFLFNSLNTLSELVHSDPGEAEKYIQELAGIYRYVIENEEKEYVPLDDEISFARAFFKLYDLREKDKIFLNINTGDTTGLMITPVSLQILIENAIKHNTASREHPLVIDIERDNYYLVVRNNLQRKNVMETMKLGLENLKERLKLITGKELKINDDGHNYIVQIPLNKQVNESIDN
ncbi:MAG: sensor histidine kinase [Bacteroidota bacterium]